MRIIKLGLISIVVFAFIITLISLFFPSNITVSKAIDISAPKDSIRAQLSDPANWKGWYPGADTMQLIVENGRVTGIRLDKKEGRTILTGTTDSTITTSTDGTGTTKMNSGWNIFPSATPNTWTVQWYMQFHLRWYPWEKFSSILLEKRYGPTMELALDRLKKEVE